MSHHADCFCAALTVLAGHGHIKQRLISAFEEHLRDIEPDALPLAVKETFADLRSRMTGVAPLNGEGEICASVRKMSIVEADACARGVVGIYAELARHHDDDEVSLPLPDADEVQVPAMLLKSV